jgi:ABC-type xylose transport system permease subunit
MRKTSEPIREAVGPDPGPRAGAEPGPFPGGVGGIRGTLLGVLLLGLIGTGLDWLGVSSYYQQIVKGAIIVGAVWLDRRGRRM